MSFDYSRGCFANSKIPKRPECKLPSVATYTKAFKAFRKRYPGVKDISALERDQPLLAADLQEPQARGAVHMAAKKNCRGCTIVARRRARPAPGCSAT